jgi:hypothetical protein
VDMDRSWRELKRAVRVGARVMSKYFAVRNTTRTQDSAAKRRMP